jgi:hypothetical protein
MSFSRNQIWLGFDLQHPEDWALGDRSEIAQMPAGRSVEFLVALLVGGTVDNLAEFTSLTLEVKPVTGDLVKPTDAALMSCTVAAVDFNTQLNIGQWNAGTGYHAAFRFAAEATGLTTSATEGYTDYALLVTGQGSAGVVEVGRAKLRVYKSGSLSAPAEPAVGAPAVVRADVFEAAMRQAIKKVNAAGTTFVILNEDGYGVELYITNGPNPELKTRVIDPAS